MLNNTTQCTCGREKRRTLHFCETCWGALRPQRMQRINDILAILRAELSTAERDLAQEAGK